MRSACTSTVGSLPSNPKPALPLQGEKLICSGLPISPEGGNVESQSLSPERVTENQIPLQTPLPAPYYTLATFPEIG